MAKDEMWARTCLNCGEGVEPGKADQCPCHWPTATSKQNTPSPLQRGSYNDPGNLKKRKELKGPVQRGGCSCAVILLVLGSLLVSTNSMLAATGAATPAYSKGGQIMATVFLPFVIALVIVLSIIFNRFLQTKEEVIDALADRDASALKETRSGCLWLLLAGFLVGLILVKFVFIFHGMGIVISTP